MGAPSSIMLWCAYEAHDVCLVNITTIWRCINKSYRTGVLVDTRQLQHPWIHGASTSVPYIRHASLEHSTSLVPPYTAPRIRIRRLLRRDMYCTISRCGELTVKILRGQCWRLGQVQVATDMHICMKVHTQTNGNTEPHVSKNTHTHTHKQSHTA